MSLSRSGPFVLVSWPAYETGFTLQSNADLTLPAGWNSIGVSPPVVGGQYTVTNPATGKRFYRLANH